MSKLDILLDPETWDDDSYGAVVRCPVDMDFLNDAHAELAALRKRCEALEKALEEIAKGATTAMEPPTSCGAACGNLDDAYSDGFARAIWSVGIEARKALRGGA